MLRQLSGVYREGATEREVRAHTIIISTGATAKKLDIPGNNEFWQRGISACAVCDGALPMFRKKVMVVVGGGDTACEEASYLSKFASKVYLVHRRDSLRASKAMQQRVFANEKISVIWDSAVEEAVGNDTQLTHLKIKNLRNGEVTQIEATGLFYAIGHVPNSAIFKGQLAMTPEGYLLTRTALAWKDVEAPADLLDSMPNYGSGTNIEGVFACGDVVDTHYRQAITAAGSGCAAAMDCEKWLEAQGE